MKPTDYSFPSASQVLIMKKCLHLVLFLVFLQKWLLCPRAQQRREKRVFLSLFCARTDEFILFFYLFTLGVKHSEEPVCKAHTFLYFTRKPHKSKYLFPTFLRGICNFAHILWHWSGTSKKCRQMLAKHGEKVYNRF